MNRCVDLDEKVTAQFYDQEHEEWTMQTVTIEDVLDSVCDEYTVLPLAQPEQRWIPCKVQNPKETGLYTVTVYIRVSNDRILDLAWYDVKRGWAKYYPVIAWMESPIPYKEEQDANGT